jgi:hypothetical protein
MNVLSAPLRRDRQNAPYPPSGLFTAEGQRDDGESVVNPEPHVVRGISRFSIGKSSLRVLCASNESRLWRDEWVVE